MPRHGRICLCEEDESVGGAGFETSYSCGDAQLAEMTGGRPPRAVVAQLCTIGDVFGKITTVKGDPNCQAGCAQGTGVCPQNWYPGADDICNAECGRVFEPFCAPLTSTALLRPLHHGSAHT